jgi:DUF4097 and DUF4098 domain-containing protein YvlB
MEPDTLSRREMLTGTRVILATISGCVTSAGGKEITETEVRRFDVSAETTLAVDNVNGPVTVEATTGEEVTVKIERTGTERALDDVAVATTHENGRLELTTEADESDTVVPRVATVALTIRCPAGVVVDQVVTANGDITARDVAGTVSLQTTNGAVEANGLEAVGDTTTANGDIDVTVPVINTDTRIDSTNGAITARLGPSLSADVTATTTEGSVTAEGGLGLSRGDNGLSGTLGEGTHNLAIETTTGDIRLVGGSV